MAIIWKDSFKIKDEVPTARFWTMCKLRFSGTKYEELWSKRWDIYIADLKDWLINNMTFSDFDGKTTSSIEKNKVAGDTINKIERSAYLTIPSSFLISLGIPRVLRR